METSKKLTKTISISPNYMNKNIVSAIVHMLKTKYEKTCSEEDGMIISVENITKLDNTISKDSCYVNFSVTFLAKVIKPEIGMSLEITPTLILSKGIFGKIYDTINLFIPENNIKDWSFDENTFKKGKKVINKDKSVKVIITDIKFNSTKYNCICKLDDK